MDPPPPQELLFLGQKAYIALGFESVKFWLHCIPREGLSRQVGSVLFGAQQAPIVKEVLQ